MELKKYITKAKELDLSITKFILALCQYNARHLTMMYLGAIVVYICIVGGIEQLIWGIHFTHIFDTIFQILITFGYLYYLHALGDLLLSVASGKEPKIGTIYVKSDE